MLLPGPLWLHLEVTGMFLLLAVGTVALHAPCIRVPGCAATTWNHPAAPAWAGRRISSSAAVPG
jgi:hypothetical protein